MKFLKQNAFFLSLALLLGLGGNFYFLKGQESKSQKIFILHNGIETCFARLNQTFTSFMIGQSNSSYLNPAFMRESEECLGEALREATNLEASEDHLFGLLNTLSSESHWFHQKIGTPLKVNPLTNANSTEASLNSYKKIEDIKEKVLASLERVNDLTIKNLEYFWPIFFVATPLFFLIIIPLLYRSRRLQIMTNELEKVSSTETLDMTKKPSRNWETLFMNYLSFSGLIKTKEMVAHFNQSQSPVLIRPSVAEQKYISPRIVTTLKKENAEIANTEISTENSTTDQLDTHINLFEQCNLEDILGQVIDLVANNIFSKGIILNLNVQENLYVDAYNEGMIEIIFNLLSALIEHTPEGNTRKILNIVLKEENHKIIFITNTQISKDNSEFLSNCSLGINEKIKAFGPKLEICSELLKDLNTKLELEDTSSQNEGKVTFKICFQQYERPQLAPQLKIIKKGKKRDLLKEFQDQKIQSLSLS